MASTETPTQPSVKLYWLNDSRAQRIVWLLEELNLPYSVELFQRAPDMRAPPELQKVHALGKIPIVRVTLPDASGSDPTRTKDIVLAESGFIAQYLVDHFGQARSLAPKRYHEEQEGRAGGETDEWMRYQYFLHYVEGSLQPPLLVGLVLGILKSPMIPFFIRPITSSVVDKMFAAFLVPELATHLAFLEAQLETSPGGGDYLCGTHLTAADILMSFPLLLAKERTGGLSAGKGRKRIAEQFPRVWAYLGRLQEEPGYKRAEARIKELSKQK